MFQLDTVQMVVLEVLFWSVVNLEKMIRLFFDLLKDTPRDRATKKSSVFTSLKAKVLKVPMGTMVDQCWHPCKFHVVGLLVQ